MRSVLTKVSISLTSIFLPFVAMSQGPTGPGGTLGPIGNLVESVGNVIDLAIPVVTGLALIGFFWGLTQYVFQSGDEEAQDEGKNKMIAGVVALFMIAAIGGIIELLQQAFGVEQGQITPEQDIPGLTN
jgi:hypothetical protein